MEVNEIFKKIILYLIIGITIFSISSKEMKIIKNNEILREYKKEILLLGEYEKREGITYKKETGELFTGRTAVIENNKIVDATAEYIDGKKNGNQYDYYPNGKLELIIPFLNNEKNGLQKDYFPNGKIKMETELKNGENNGYQYRYDEKGNLGMKLEYKEGKIQTMEVYSVAIIQKGNVTGFNNAKLVVTNGEKGIMTTYKDKLKLMESEVVITDHERAQLAQEGKVTYFYPNGRVKTVLTKKNNMTEGVIRSYSENGTLIIETNGKNNKQDGEVKIYYETGEKQLWCERLVGEMVRGNCEIYAKDGRILHKGYFDNVSLDVLRREKTGEINSIKDMLKVIKRYM